MPQTEAPLHHTAHDGEPITTLRWLPPTAPRAIVQIAHGMGEHAGRYAGLAQRLTEQGYAVYANLHRGHGERARSQGTLGDFGPGGFAALAADLLCTHQLARAQHPGVRAVLLGHSMGSFAAQLLLAQHADMVDAVALSGSAALDLVIAAQARGEGMAQPNARITTPRTPCDWLSRDTAVVDAYVADPLCGFRLSKASALSMFAQTEAMYSLDNLRRIPPGLPLYLFTGDQDPVNGYLAHFHPLVARYTDAGLTRVTQRIYAGARHEVLNELQRREVEDDLLAWLADAV